jgi:hypothetical protein
VRSTAVLLLVAGLIVAGVAGGGRYNELLEKHPLSTKAVTSGESFVPANERSVKVPF